MKRSTQVNAVDYTSNGIYVPTAEYIRACEATAAMFPVIFPEIVHPEIADKD